MKPAKRCLSIDLPFANLRPALLGAVALLSYRVLPMTAGAQEPVAPEPPAEVANAPLSAEGRQLLAATLFVAASLVGMERFCSWRLGARQRRADQRPPVLAECLPAVFPTATES
ncbi:MAG: hypothetical protein INR65_11520 [Gluconacetobacter diazotrophicus]|nr:hypothetical protein [Gluconacetobacter diazotrophicus]